MLLKLKHFVIFLTISTVTSCTGDQKKLSKIVGQQVAVDSIATSVDSIENFIAPFRERVNDVMDANLAYAPKTMSKHDGERNTTAGNLMADVILQQAGPIFKRRTGNTIDFVVFNHGGIRSIVSKGVVTTRTAYQVMPFENRIAVVEMSGPAVRELVSFLINASRPHPISGLQIILNKDNSLQSVNVNGEPFDENRNYFVATSDYLVQGGDNMGFFKNKTDVHFMDYMVRNALIDYFTKVDTLTSQVDDRFIKL